MRLNAASFNDCLTQSLIKLTAQTPENAQELPSFNFVFKPKISLRKRNGYMVLNESGIDSMTQVA